MRILERCMSAWPMPDMQKQVDAVREAFSADVRKPFVLRASFPYGSPMSSHSSPPRSNPGYQANVVRTGPMDQRLDAQVQQHSYGGHPITPPTSAGPGDIKTDQSDIQSMVMMPGGQGSQGPAMQHGLSLAGAPTWNPSRIFEYVAHAYPSVSRRLVVVLTNMPRLVNGTRLSVRLQPSLHLPPWPHRPVL